MSQDDFKQLCRTLWDEEYNYLCIERFKRKIVEEIVFVMKAKTHINRMYSPNEAILFNINVIFNWKQRTYKKFRRTSFSAKSNRRNLITRQTR